jgi:hypothetical protein
MVQLLHFSSSFLFFFEKIPTLLHLSPAYKGQSRNATPHSEHSQNTRFRNSVARHTISHSKNFDNRYFDIGTRRYLLVRYLLGIGFWYEVADNGNVKRSFSVISVIRAAPRQRPEQQQRPQRPEQRAQRSQWLAGVPPSQAARRPPCRRLATKQRAQRAQVREDFLTHRLFYIYIISYYILLFLFYILYIIQKDLGYTGTHPRLRMWVCACFVRTVKNAGSI